MRQNTLGRSLYNNWADVASKGRFGDTKIRMLQGKPQHVNPVEANLIDIYGQQGEDLVNRLGSKTINPETGLEENFPWGWLVAAVITVLGVGSAAYEYGEATGSATSGTSGGSESEAPPEPEFGPAHGAFSMFQPHRPSGLGGGLLSNIGKAYVPSSPPSVQSKPSGGTYSF
jgi:hypothetical protein